MAIFVGTEGYFWNRGSYSGWPEQFFGGLDLFPLGAEQLYGGPDHFPLRPVQFFEGPDHFPLGPEQFFWGLDFFPLGAEQFFGLRSKSNLLVQKKVK